MRAEPRPEAVTAAAPATGATSATSAEERYFIASQRQLMWRKFKKHRLAVVSGVILVIAYLAAFAFEFCAPYGPLTQHEGFVNAPPTRIRLFDPDGRLRAPFVYGLSGTVNMDTFQREFVEDTAIIHPLRFFAPGETYRFWGQLRRQPPPVRRGRGGASSCSAPTPSAATCSRASWPAAASA